jgi:LysM domain-containing protein
VWATDTNGQDVVRYTSDKPVWDTDTKGAKDVKLVLQDDRNVVLYAADGPAWSSKTDTTEPPPPAPDTLWAISEQFYGDGSKYQVIADASGVSNPDLIAPGQVLTIP